MRVAAAPLLLALAACAQTAPVAAGPGKTSDASDGAQASPSDSGAEGASRESDVGAVDVRAVDAADTGATSPTLPPACTALAHCCLVAPGAQPDPQNCYEGATSGDLTEAQCAYSLATYTDAGMCLGDGGL